MAQKKRKPGINSQYAKRTATEAITQRNYVRFLLLPLTSATSVANIKKIWEREELAHYESVRRNIPVLDGRSKNRLRALNAADRFNQEARASTLDNAKFRRRLMRK